MNKDIALNSENMNNLTYIDTYRRLALLSKNMFIWKNLPDSIDPEFIEKELYHNGNIAFYKDDELGYLVAKFTNQSGLNFYNRPTSIRTMSAGTNYISKTLNIDEFVIIPNNIDHVPTITTVQLYAKRISDVQRTIDINISAQRTPLLLVCDDKERLTLLNLYKQYEGNRPVIMGHKKLTEITDSMKVINTEAPYVADRLHKYKHDLLNEFYTYIGINNVNSDKRERLIVDEARANDEQIDLSASTMLSTRKLACEKINKMFDLNIDVELNKIEIKNVLDTSDEYIEDMEVEDE